MLRNLIRISVFLVVAAAALWNAGVTRHDLGLGDDARERTAFHGSDDPASYPADGDECSAGDILDAPADDLTPRDGSLTWAGAADALPDSYAAPAPQRDESRATVYITNTGEKYHRGSCQHLRRSKHPVSLADAKRQGYTACKVCRPPR